MASIASFCLFNKTDLGEFVEVVTVPLKQRTRAAVLKHPLHKFRSKCLTQLAEYHWSGYVFAFELPAFLKTRSIVWSEFSAARESKELADAIGMPVELFGLPKTRILITALDSVLDDPNLDFDIGNFLKKYPKTEPRTDPKLPPTALFDAILVLRYWLGRIEAKQFGLLEVSV